MKIKYFLLILLFVPVANWLQAQANYFTLNYSTSSPMGETRDYIDSYSWRGVSIEGQWLVNEHFSMGYNFAWNVFHQKFSGQFVDGTTTLTGTQLRHLNVFPLFFEGRYHLGDISVGGFAPYLGLGTGLIYADQRTEIGLFAIDKDSWQFALAPAAGLMIPLTPWSMLNLGVKYNYAFETNSLHSNNFLNVNLGVVWLR